MKMAMLGLVGAIATIGCDQAPGPSAEPPPPARPSAPGTGMASMAPQVPRAYAIDVAAIASATGGNPETDEGVIKVSFPRDDVTVEMDGWAMPPFMGLTSWAGFVPGEKPGVEAMVMGDLVLFEDEVGDAMKTALAAGLEVTALHNHFFFEKPRVYFMHIGGEGTVDTLGKGLRATLDAAKSVRKGAPMPADRFAGPRIPTTSAIDPATVEAAIGRNGSAKDGMVKVVVGRAASKASCGCKIGKAMGINTWAAFAGTDADAVVDGDFAVTEDELQPVLKSLTGAGIHVVAIHNHMVGEEPRILFLHYWGRGPVDALARSLRTAIALTKTEG